MLFALHVVVLSMLLGRSAMGLGGILVMFRRLIMSVFRHGIPPVSWGLSNGMRAIAGRLLAAGR
jgi:hypothetical protein